MLSPYIHLFTGTVSYKTNVSMLQRTAMHVNSDNS